MHEEKAWRQFHKDAAINTEEVLAVSHKKSIYTATYHPSRKLSKLDEPDMQATVGEVKTYS